MWTQKRESLYIYYYRLIFKLIIKGKIRKVKCEHKIINIFIDYHSYR